MTGTVNPSKRRVSVSKRSHDLERLVCDLAEHCVRTVNQRLKPNPAQIKRVVDNRHELTEAVTRVFVGRVLALSDPNRYAKEQKESGSAYPLNYRGPRPIAEQIRMIGDLFGLSTTNALNFAQNLVMHPTGSEGWFAFPKPESVMRYSYPLMHDHKTWMGPKTLQIAFTKLMHLKSGFVPLDGDINPRCLRQHPKTIDAFGRLHRQQLGDIVVVPAQFGVRYVGMSARRARVCFKENEFGLGAFHVACMILTHPERFGSEKHLQVDCPGDFYSVNDGNTFDQVPAFCMGKQSLEAIVCPDNHASRIFGSVTALLPE